MPNNNLSCIPFYGSLEEQDYRKWYAYGDNYLLKVPSDYLIPFYLEIAPQIATTITDIVIYDCCGNSMGSYLDEMESNGLNANYFGNSKAAYYPANHQTSLNLSKGLYYMAITLGGMAGSVTYYSDVFCVDTRANLERDCIYLKWWNEENVEYEGGVIPYEVTSFKNEIWLDSEIGMPSYNFSEEGEERNGFFFPTKQISEKAYNFKFVAPEYLCDAMRLVRMADAVRITDKLGRTYNVEQFEMDVEWLEQGHYASVDCNFQTNTIVKKVGKAYTNISER